MTEIPPQSSTNSSPNRLSVSYILIGVLGIIVIFGVVLLLKSNPPQTNPARITESTSMVQLNPTQIVTPEERSQDNVEGAFDDNSLFGKILNFFFLKTPSDKN